MFVFGIGPTLYALYLLRTQGADAFEGQSGMMSLIWPSVACVVIGLAGLIVFGLIAGALGVFGAL